MTLTAERGVTQIPSAEPPQWLHWLRRTVPERDLPTNRSSVFDGDDEWVEFEPVGPSVWTATSYAVTASSLLAPRDERRMQARLDDALTGPASALASSGCIGCGRPAAPRVLVNGVCAECERSYGPRDIE